ncbi:putative ABC transporter C family member 15 [Vigna unguiculata]|uniref:ABC-type xenobiotic transporter n=1 Tax=Vigna unguiculata TaxID=3917 RepID=A0A4D6L4J0_VIGUN|nr:putative ABC transporter C family member 15 [Vigna unguiculata]XP_027920250.1 putative ABC transporter C family member 15 [Vigna unguiculata]QCD83409.1 ATP-binding cassette [Vigna unguiculata]
MVVLDAVLGTLNVAFLYAILIWVLVDSLRQSKRTRVPDGSFKRGPMLLPAFTLLSCAVLSLMNMVLVFHQYTSTRVIGFYSVSLTLTWVLATVVSFYSVRTRVRENKRFPLVLILWWIFSSLVDVLSLSVRVVKDLEALDLWFFLSEDNLVASFSLPLLVVLCFNVCRRERSDMEEGLLQIEEECSMEEHDEEAFTNASVWNKLIFRWLNPIFKTGRVKKLELSHIPPVPCSESAESASSMLEGSLRKQKLGEGSLAKAIADSIWKSLALNAVLAGVNTGASYIGPLLITNFVNFLLGNNGDSSVRYGLVLAFVFFLAKTVESLSQRQWYFGAQRIGIRVRAALMSLIYSHSLTMKCAGATQGKIINLINVDVERIGDFCWYIHGVWLLPVQVILALIILYINLGYTPSFAAFGVTILVMVCNTPLANRQESLHSKIMEAKDSRIKMTSETMKNIRILKLHSWETSFLQKLLQLRETERGWLQKYLYTCSAVATLFWTSPTLVSVVTFGACMLVKTELTAATVLSALATFRILQEPIYNLPELISMIIQTKVSLDRIQDFLDEEDQTQFINRHTSKNSSVAIEINPGEYAWETHDQTHKKPTIQITRKLVIKKGQKVAVCGSVGSGKSSLLCCILGEIPLVSGALTKVYGTRSYVPQSPWIQSGTVRENILFGKQMNKEFYEDVLDGCALKQDINMWGDGDLNLVEERGINLSGGQKQRVQLARAVYNNSDIYFLDDPFSAVDAHTGTHLFKKCLMKLLYDKTVVYATHQLEFLESADLILVMKDGKIVESGRYKDLIACPNSELVQQMAAHQETVHQINPSQEDDFASYRPCPKNQIEVTRENIQDIMENWKRNKEEERETGRVKWSVYSTFVTSAYKGALVPVILLCQILFQVMQIGSNYWMSWATEQKGKVDNKKLMKIFILLSSGGTIFILGRTVLMAAVAVETAQRFFHGMITSVFRAPVSFFDTTPSSRILSRSSTDQSTVDTDIPYRLAGLVFALIQLLSIIVLMSQVAWQVILLFFVVLAISIWYQSYYITTARELARMVGIRKAPILHHFSESIAGAATIRCFNQEQLFLTKVNVLIDDYSRVAFYNFGTMEWLSVRINFLFNLVFYFVLVILVTLPRSTIDPSLAGLVATYGLNLNVLQAWVIWNLCNVENKMISVERILQFSNIPSEAPLIIKDCRPEQDWPKEGNVELHNLHIRYDPAAPMVLKGVTCVFPGQKKIGIVGRTGSGKSTLLQALFRVVEPLEGSILIDGVDISKIGLQDLRSKLGIIPQDPTLFLGTVRTNLDPLEQHADQELWEVLRKCHLAEIVRRDPRLLDAPVAENGENWSVGQRQLVCLARLLLKKRRILVLDEATASIDTATDNLIQKTIREETSGCTVITVAHRIPTVIDNDLVLVLDEGTIAEYDDPTKLLQNSSSSFSKLVSEFLRRSSQK